MMRLLKANLQHTKKMPTSASGPAAIQGATLSAVPAVSYGEQRHDLKTVERLAGLKTVEKLAVRVGNGNATDEVAAALPMTRFVEEAADAAPKPSSKAPATAPSPSAPSGFAGLFDGMRFTVVRIQAIVAKVDWLQPYKQPSDSPFIGSGFVVESGNDDDPVFLTNAHVVQDAHIVQVQLPAIGQMIFDAYVPLICKRFDLAVVQLKEPKKFWEALALHKGTMHALPIRQSLVSLGLEVAAVGFPLGSSSLKLSRGIISGTEMVDGTICYQSTAPISPGSSGGPLFALGSENTVPGKAEDLQVIGVNFASSVSEGAQNVNYVVPTIHLLQVLHEFRHLKTKAKHGPSALVTSLATSGMLATATRQVELRPHSPHGSHDKVVDSSSKQVKEVQKALEAESKLQKSYPHFQLRIAPIDAIGIEASDALYNTSGGCHKGVFISRILPTTALRFAKPAVPERAFLVAVDDVTLDSFGMGRTANFLGDPTPFESLMTLREKIDDPVKLTVCQHGKETKHVTSIRWRPEYSLAVQDIEEPHFEDHSMDFEIFAGVTLMQMTMNHIIDLLKSGRPQTLSRWLLIENQETPRLLITHVEEGTYASRVLTPGMVVQKINGGNVSTLKGLRRTFKPKSIAWTLETDRGLIFSVKFKESLSEQVTSAVSSPGKHYLLSQAPLQAARNMNMIRSDLLELFPEPESQSLAPTAAEPKPQTLSAAASSIGIGQKPSHISNGFLAARVGAAASIV